MMGVIPEINYLMYGFIFTVLTWPVAFLYLIVRDLFKGNKFRPFYRAAWPFIAFAQIALILGG